MQVLKFGGTSVANAENIKKVVDIVLSELENDKTILVSSAIHGATDSLIEIGNKAAAADISYKDKLAELEKIHYGIVEDLNMEVFGSALKAELGELFDELRGICDSVFHIREISHCTLDWIMSFGELLSTKILAAKFTSVGINCKWLDARSVVKTDYEGGKNVVDQEMTEALISEAFKGCRSKLVIVPGFVASDKEGRVTTLSRGGGDYTAAIVAAAISARKLEIWTDVNGMMTADPRIVPGAMTIENISYREALELSHFGAKVIFPPTIQPVVSKGIPIIVKNTFDPHGKATRIERNPPEGSNFIKGISNSDNLALLSMEGSGMVGVPGYSSKLFEVLSANSINIILITQASSVHTMLVVISEKDAEVAKKAVDERFAYEISLGKLEPLKVETGYSIISLVGDDMKNHAGASGKMFEALGREGINIRAIAQGSSERNVSAIVATDDVEKSLIAIHDEFFYESQKPLNVFIIGYGNVGRQLIDVITQNGKAINIAGICNTRNRYMCKKGVDVSKIAEVLSAKSDRRTSVNDFINDAIEMRLPNSVLVDCTSDKALANFYPGILQSGIGVVTCNKIANSQDMALYHRIRAAARGGKVPFYYDTNVGAALPILKTISLLQSSGDKVEKIEAIVSGTLNYIFSEYCKEGCKDSFEAIVRRSKELGYAEPDPRTDLQGTDVLRKAIIMAREAGAEIEESDIKIEGFLPEECLSGDVESFFKALKRNEEYFSGLRRKAFDAGAKLRYVAKIEGNDVVIGLMQIDAAHPFYNCEGTDAAVSLSTKLYPTPIFIKGAGAGARITAEGVYGNICECR